MGTGLLGCGAPLLGRRRLRQLHDGRQPVDRLRATYGDNYDRLAQIKAVYDRDNVFRMNQNIAPAVSEVAPTA